MVLELYAFYLRMANEHVAYTKFTRGSTAGLQGAILIFAFATLRLCHSISITSICSVSPSRRGDWAKRGDDDAERWPRGL